MMENYSVLMSVYYKEKPEYLRESIQSMLDQTLPTNDFVIVCDGPLTPELEAVLEQFCLENPGLFQIVKIPQNVGIGAAANIGLRHCKNDLVAKMDSDDLSRCDRCEKEIKKFAKDPSLAIVGAQLAEFTGDISNLLAIRKVPTDNKSILKFAKRRMPFNNITVMYRKSAALHAGGYSSLRRCEDYDLFCRILMSGKNAENIDEILSYARIGDDAYERRGAKENLKGFVQVRWKLYKCGFSNLIDFFLPTCVQIIFTLMSAKYKQKFYQKFLRS